MNEYEIISISPLSDHDWWVVYEIDLSENQEECKFGLVKERAIGTVLYKNSGGESLIVFLPQNTGSIAIPKKLEDDNQLGLFRLHDVIDGRKVLDIPIFEPKWLYSYQ